MFKRLVDAMEVLAASATVVTVLALFLASPSLPSSPQPDTTRGAEVYGARCAGCHGPSGEGGVGPTLAGADALADFDSSLAVARFVGTGVPGRMPGFETRLSPDDINAVAEYVWVDLGGN